jgi:hypothetical protein
MLQTLRWHMLPPFSESKCVLWWVPVIMYVYWPRSETSRYSIQLSSRCFSKQNVPFSCLLLLCVLAEICALIMERHTSCSTPLDSQHENYAALCLVATWRPTTRKHQLFCFALGPTRADICINFLAHPATLTSSVPPLRFITQFYIYAENHLTTLRFCRWRHDISPKHQQHDPYPDIVTMQQQNHYTQSKKKSVDSASITMFASVYTTMNSILAPRPACPILATCINCVSCL